MTVASPRASALRPLFHTAASVGVGLCLTIAVADPAVAVTNASDDLYSELYLLAQDSMLTATGKAFTIEFSVADSVGTAGTVFLGEGYSNVWFDRPGLMSWRAGPAYGGGEEYLTWASSPLTGGHGDLAAQERANRRGEEALARAGIGKTTYVRVAHYEAEGWPAPAGILGPSYLHGLVERLNPARIVLEALQDPDLIRTLTRDDGSAGHNIYRVVTNDWAVTAKLAAGVVQAATVDYPGSTRESVSVTLTGLGDDVKAPAVPTDIIDHATLERVLGPVLLEKFRIGMASDVSRAKRTAEREATATSTAPRLASMVRELRQIRPETYRLRATDSRACIALRTRYGTLTVTASARPTSIRTQFLRPGQRCSTG